ncbi:MAG TPA: Gfo/Idh/MocA family oxidoreductase, partial [Rhodospirillales bacterium]
MKRNQKALGVAVIGLGVGEQHARAYARDGRCVLRWLFDLSARKAEALCRRIGAGGVAESYRQILADDGVDAVSIAS